MRLKVVFFRISLMARQLSYSSQRPGVDPFRSGLVVASGANTAGSIVFAFLALGPLQDDRGNSTYGLAAYGVSILFALAGTVLGMTAAYRKQFGGWIVTVFNSLLLLALIAFAVLVLVAASRAISQIRG